MNLKQRFETLILLYPFVALVVLALPFSGAHAQQVSYEGIEGFVDKDHRGPVLTISTQYYDAATSEAKQAGGAFTRILADAYIPNSDYEEYPIKFDFYINRQLRSTQLRSLSLPGAIGFDVPVSMAAPTFNYAVIATLIYPNRSFSTVIDGEVTDSNTPVNPTPTAGGLASCTMTLTSLSGTTTTYTAAEIEGGTVANNETTISFTAVGQSTGSTVPTSLALTIDGSSASGELTTTVSGSEGTTEVAGTITVSGDAVESLSVQSDDQKTSVSCN